MVRCRKAISSQPFVTAVIFKQFTGNFTKFTNTIPFGFHLLASQKKLMEFIFIKAPVPHLFLQISDLYSFCSVIQFLGKPAIQRVS